MKIEKEDIRIQNALLQNDLDTALGKIKTLDSKIIKLETELLKIPELEREIENQELMRTEVEKMLEEARQEIETLRGDKVSQEIQVEPEVEEKEAQTEEEMVPAKELQ